MLPKWRAKTFELQPIYQGVPGSLQTISLVPFAFVMFMEEQIAYLRALTKKRQVVLFFDATGTFCKKLPPPFDTNVVYYCTYVWLSIIVFHAKRQPNDVLFADLWPNQHEANQQFPSLSFTLQHITWQPLKTVSAHSLYSTLVQLHCPTAL